jgi:hypothetical protein
MVPDVGLFPIYLRNASRVTDAPGPYHVGALLGVMSAVACPHARASIRVGRDERREPLHLWILLVGPSGNRKTTCVNLASEAAEKVLGGRYRSPLGSAAGIEEMVLREPHPFMLIPEAPTWFAGNRASYMHDGAALYCDLYDGRIRRRNVLEGAPRQSKRRKGEPQADTIKQVNVTILAAGATAGLMRSTRRVDWEGGLLSRVLIVGAGEPRYRPIPFSWDESFLDSFKRRLIAVENIAKRTQTVSPTDAARKEYEAWSFRLHAGLRGLSDAHSILCNRLTHHVLRIASLYALSRLSTEITGDDMIRACHFGLYCRDSILALELS